MDMMNLPEVYKDAGIKAGRAFRNRDNATYRSWRDWFNEARKLERTAEALLKADVAWHEGYSIGNPPRTPKCFR